MKRIVSVIISALMLLSVISVSADTAQVNAGYNADTREITISGTFPARHGTINVFVSKYDENTMNSHDDLTDLNIAQNVVQATTWNGEGSLVLKVKSTTPVGYYIVFCGAKGMESAESNVFYITDVNEQNAAIEAFKTATTENIGTVITTYCVEKPIISLNLANAIYTANTADVCAAFVKCMAEETERLAALSPAGVFDFASITQSFEKAIALVDFNVATDKDAKFDACKSLFGMTLSTDGTTHKAAAIDLMSKQSEAVDGKILSQTDFVKAFNKGVAICVINGSTRDTIKANLIAYDDIIGIDAEAGYSASNEENLNAEMAFGAFETTEKIAEKFATAVRENPKTTGSGSGDIFTGGSTGGSATGGGGGGGGGSTAVARPTTTPESSGNVVVSPVGFSDISSYTWAHDAIKYLSDKEVLKGVGDGKFEPARNIKREEYAKIMVEAFGMKAKGETKVFSDVAPDSWYYNYVNIACQNGLINGVDEENFGSGNFVTREQAAVIIYRYLLSTGYKFTADGKDFDDIDACSDYAKEAIKALKNNGLISGSGNNRFAPKEPLNRAQAAVMVYNIINVKEAK